MRCEGLHRRIYRQVAPFLSDAQHGFRQKRSVETNLLTLVDIVSRDMEGGGQVDVAYLDFKKAFDRVDNDILLGKLCAIGFSPKHLRLCSDYLRDRQQFVRHGCYVSEPYHTRSGVSQGSILGPLFFILMINYLESQLHNSTCLLYADDLKLSMRVRGEADCALLQQDLDAVHQWSLDNKLLFNTSKCAVMSYTRAKNPFEADYRLGMDVILRVYTITDLGVTFDTKLTFHDHVKALTANCFRRLGFVIRNAKDFSQTCVIQLLYSALVRSKVESSSVVWSPHESTYTLMLEKVQKAFLRFLYKKKYGHYPYLYPTSFLLGMLGFNSLEVRRDLNLAIMACRTLRGETECPHMVGEVCCLFAPNKYLRARSHRLLAVGAARSVARQQSPLIRATTMVNAIIDSAPQVDVFADGWPKLKKACLKFCESE